MLTSFALKDVFCPNYCRGILTDLFGETVDLSAITRFAGLVSAKSLANKGGDAGKRFTVRV